MFCIHVGICDPLYSSRLMAELSNLYNNSLNLQSVRHFIELISESMELIAKGTCYALHFRSVYGMICRSGT